MPEVRDHEPHEALTAVRTVLSFTGDIRAGRKLFKRGQGKLLFEIGYDQGRKVPELMETNGFADVQVLKDLAGMDRVVTGIWHKTLTVNFDSKER